MAPGIPEHIRTIGRLMNMDFRWIKQRAMYIATVHDTRGVQAMDHHFECDPKMMDTEQLWMEWLKLVADFIADKGIDTKIVKTKLKDMQAFYTGELVHDNEQQNSTTGSLDDGHGFDGASGSAGANRDWISSSESGGSPAPIAPDWPNAALSDGSGSTEADDHAD